MKYVDDTPTLLNFVESSRIFEFLAGLNAEFDPVRVQILGKEQLPSLNEVFFIVSDEKSRRMVMLESRPIEGSQLLSTNTLYKDGRWWK